MKSNVAEFSEHLNISSEYAKKTTINMHVIGIILRISVLN